MITVLMPVYNGGVHLGEAIESILNQRFKDFEFLIIDDGSTDNTAQLIRSYQDARIRFIQNDRNIGLVESLNKGLDISTSDYLVRMDGDDVSDPNRLTLQVEFMERNRTLGASGCYYHFLNSHTKSLVDLPLKNEEIKSYLLFNSPIAHPSAIIRRSVLLEHRIRYDSNSTYAEDYSLWSQIARHSGLANIPKSLLGYRIHSGQITSDKNKAALKAASVRTIRKNNLLQIGLNPTDEEMEIHGIISDGRRPETVSHLLSAQQWLKKIVLHNKETDLLNPEYLDKVIAERWMRLCYNYYGRKGFRFLLRSELYSDMNLTMKHKLQLMKSMYYSWRRLQNRMY